MDEPEKNANDTSSYKYLGLVSGIGGTMITCILLGLLLGMYLSKKYNAPPWIDLVLVVFGILIGVWSVYFTVVRELKRDSLMK